MPAAYLIAYLAGLLLLVRASAALVVGSSTVASRLGVSTLLVGVVVIGFGTSLPELLVAGLAAAGGSPAVGIGAVIGSNIANLSLVLGSAAIVATIIVRDRTVRREAPLALLGSLAFAVALQAGLSRPEGVVLLLLLAGSLTLLVRWALGERDHPDEGAEELSDDVEDLVTSYAARPMTWVVAQTLAGLLGTLLGAQALVWGAVGLADAFGLPEGFVGATIVALGTSLPELAAAVQAARRDEPDLIVGNLLGSNLLNALGSGGLVAVIAGGTTVGWGLGVLGVSVMLGVSTLALLFMRRGFRVVRSEGVVLVVVYLVAIPLLALA